MVAAITTYMVIFIQFMAKDDGSTNSTAVSGATSTTTSTPAVKQTH